MGGNNPGAPQGNDEGNDNKKSKADDTIIGGNQNDNLNGGRGDDTVDGGDGNDRVHGGQGDDNIGGGDGNDRVYGGQGDDRIDGGDGNDRLFGGQGDDTINNSGGSDTLSKGGDTMKGGSGNDTYQGFNAGFGNDMIQDAAGANDVLDLSNMTLQSVTQWAMAANAHDLKLTFASGDTLLIKNYFDDAVNLAGGGLIETIRFSDGTVTLADMDGLINGGSGDDTGTGGGGNDVPAGETQTGSDTQDNMMTGGTGNDTLTGGALNDTLSGGSGNDVLNGGSDGADTYVFAPGAGTDSVIDGAGEDTLDLTQFDTAVTVDLSTGTVSGDGTWVTGVGSVETVNTGSGNDSITGNASDNWINGGLGADTMAGGNGNDTYVVDNIGDVVLEGADAGTDTVISGMDYTLTDNVENLTLGSGAVNGTGNANNNQITGNAADNVLDGQAGADTMIGGSGNDTYRVNDPGDTVVENPDEGTDTVYSEIDYTLGDNVENLVLIGEGNIQGVGNTAGNEITGNTGNNNLDGRGGTDTMIGGSGNDTYYADGADVLVENAGEGIDTIISSESMMLGEHFENMVLTGFGSASATGNTLDNVITGNNADNTLDGRDGNDSMTGGLGNDTYIINNEGDMVLENEGEGQDVAFSFINFSLSGNLENLVLMGSDNLNGTGNTADNLITGNSGNNVLEGQSGIDTLIGGIGDDTYGVDGLDVIVENAGEGTDTVQASASYTLGGNLENLMLMGLLDLVGTGSTGNNLITGNVGNNTLLGGAGVDTLAGGLGDDTYSVDSTTDVITEQVGEGTDTVQSSVAYTLGANVENLVLTGTATINGVGNAINNRLEGNAGDNIMVGNNGNDTINPGAGSDFMDGGGGNDTYELTGNFGSDQMTDAGGIDALDMSRYTTAVNASFTTGAVTVGSNTLTGITMIEIYWGGSGSDTVNGNALANQLHGGAGNDTLTGNGGNDIFYGDAGADRLADNSGDDQYIFVAGDGNDTIADSAGTDILNLTALTTGVTVNLPGGITAYSGGSITGAGSIDIIWGGSGNDTLNANGVANTLVGGLGNDTMQGVGGADRYLYATKVEFGNDIIYDSAGTTDVLSMSPFKTTDAVWTAVDTNSDNAIDSLNIDFGVYGTILVSNYFNNASATVSVTSQGVGLLESMIFSNDSAVSYADVLVLIA